MTRAEAMEELGLSGAAAAEKVEAAYRRRHADLQRRMAESPPSLAVKLRQSIDRLDEARAVLAGGASDQDLPVAGHRPSWGAGSAEHPLKSPARAVDPSSVAAPIRFGTPQSAKPPRWIAAGLLLVAALLAALLAGWFLLALTDQMAGSRLGAPPTSAEPPRVRILAPSDGSTVAGDEVALFAVVTGHVTEVKVSVNGRGIEGGVQLMAHGAEVNIPVWLNPNDLGPYTLVVSAVGPGGRGVDSVTVEQEI